LILLVFALLLCLLLLLNQQANLVEVRISLFQQMGEAIILRVRKQTQVAFFIISLTVSKK
jgi:hypothetical protein